MVNFTIQHRHYGWVSVLMIYQKECQDKCIDLFWEEDGNQDKMLGQQD